MKLKVIVAETVNFAINILETKTSTILFLIIVFSSTT